MAAETARVRRVAMVAPVPPFRSGIARHSGALARALAARADVALSVHSFARLYPAALYPGAAERDPETPPMPGARYEIDALAPMSWARAARGIAADRPDLALMPAWTFVVAPCLGALSRRLRRAGVPVVMLAHNAEDHEAAVWKRALMRRQTRWASAFVTHNEAIAVRLSAAHPRVEVGVAPHPVYDDFPEPRGLWPREAPLELLFFGIVRRYKGLDIALEAVARRPAGALRLTVMGEFWEGRAETQALIDRLGIADRVELRAGFASEADAAEAFARADALVAPYRSASASGVVAMAQHYARPVIASDLPGLSEAVCHGVTGWLFPTGDAGALAALLDGTVTRESAAAMAPAIAQAGARRSWARLAETVLSVVG